MPVRVRSVSKLYLAARGSSLSWTVPEGQSALIEENLDSLDIPETRTEIVCVQAETFTGREHSTPWDIVYFDPPYDSDYSTVLLDLGTAAIGEKICGSGVLIAEHHVKKQLPDAAGALRRWRLLKQGENCLSFYEYS